DGVYGVIADAVIVAELLFISGKLVGMQVEHPQSPFGTDVQRFGRGLVYGADDVVLDGAGARFGVVADSAGTALPNAQPTLNRPDPDVIGLVSIDGKHIRGKQIAVGGLVTAHAAGYGI